MKPTIIIISIIGFIIIIIIDLFFYVSEHVRAVGIPEENFFVVC